MEFLFKWIHKKQYKKALFLNDDNQSRFKVSNVEVIELYKSSKNLTYYINLDTVLSNGNEKKFVWAYDTMDLRDSDIKHIEKNI